AWQHGEEMDSTDIALAERARIGKSLPDLTVHALPRNPPMRVQLSTRLISSVVVVVATLLAANIAMAQWPNNPTDDPRDALPNDPSYLNVDMMGNVTGGQWNLWSFTPDNWTEVVAAERPLGIGLHADRAWQITPGDKRVVIAVLDSGIKWDEGDLNE